MKKIFLVSLTIGLVLIGGGCDQSVKNIPIDQKEVVVIPTLPNKESINLYDVKLFLRSRDDVKPGQADVNQQSLFAQTKDGQTIEIVKDVHEALEGKLSKDFFLVMEKNNLISNRYVNFHSQNDIGIFSSSFKFDKEQKKFLSPSDTNVTPEDLVMFQVSRFTHQKFGFNFLVPSNFVTDFDVKFSENGNDLKFVDKNSKDVVATIIVQPGIPGIPLASNKIEKIKVNGIPAHLYHDTDQADGGNIDKLIVDFPDGKNTVYIAAPDSPEFKQLDLKAVAASWKWKKQF